MTPTEARIRELLSEVYEPDGVDIWLNSRNRWLGGQRGIDLIREGRGQEVLAAAEYLSGGGW